MDRYAILSHTTTTALKYFLLVTFPAVDSKLTSCNKYCLKKHYIIQLILDGCYQDNLLQFINQKRFDVCIADGRVFKYKFAYSASNTLGVS